LYWDAKEEIDTTRRELIKKDWSSYHRRLEAEKWG